MTYYESTVLRTGSEASELEDGGVLILYADPIPDALESVSVVHAPSGPPSAAMRPGHVLGLGDQQLRITRVGELANENLRTLGHVVVYVDPGDDAPLLPGAVHASGPLVTPQAGAMLRLAETPS
jgi:PTS system glucitol/sorbitol-specific IIA component